MYTSYHRREIARYMPNDHRTASPDIASLDIASLATVYAAGATPKDTVREISRRIAARGEDGVWISRVPDDALIARAETIERQRRDGVPMPLYGVPFAVKDNIDVAGVATTAGCPEFAYLPPSSATVVQRLLAAGAIYVGKTNLDQFATGLVGTRSPYGVCKNSFDPHYISGGSSSGSGVAVATGLVSFALGTDTAGSGRVPAAFNNVVGLKPTRGLVSNTGIVPACRSLDCVAVFALTCGDAEKVLAVIGGFDASDPYSRTVPAVTPIWNGASNFRFGVPRESQWEFFGDTQAQALYAQALRRLETLGGTRVEIDYTPFRETAALLYGNAWVAERLSSVHQFVQTSPDALDPTVREILLRGENYSAVEVFLAQQRLEQLRRQAETQWQHIDVLALPTTPTIFTIAQVQAEPIQRNTELGYYTNFVNLLDLCAIAVPAGRRHDGLPVGITLIGRAFSDGAVCALGARYHGALGGTLGATSHVLPTLTPSIPVTDTVRVAVVGAHLRGQPLNRQLIERNARLLKSCRTADGYRLYALAGTHPPKPGLVYEPTREPGADTAGVEVEVWEMPTSHFGSFVAMIPAPLGIGTITLDDGDSVKGFLCERHAVANAIDITHYGGWRAYLAHLSSLSQPSATA